MKVVELTAFHVRIPLRRAIQHASHTRTETDNIVVRCLLDDRSEGFGEGLPREYVTGETIDSALELLKRSDFASQFALCRDFVASLAMIERMKLADVPGDERGCAGNAARCAVELALLDAAGRSFGEPLSHVTKFLAPELYQPRERVRYSGAITSARGLKLRAAGWAMRLYGFRQLKVKVGIPGFDDVKRLRIIRRGAGRRMDIRVDANEAWPPGDTVERIRDSQRFGITSVEQPVAHEHLGALAEIRTQVQTPVMLDESLCSRFDAQRAVELKACDLFNLRISKCGGFIPALRLAQFAKQHDIGCQLGCQVGETAILSAAGRAFASSVADLRYVEGSYDRHLVAEALGVTDLTFGYGGWAPLLIGSGLGVRISPAALARVIVRKESLLG